MDLSSFLTDISLYVIEFIFGVYIAFARFLLKPFLPIVKPVVRERMEGYGLKIDGDGDSDPKVQNDELYIRAALEGETGMYESYIEGHWTSKDLVKTFATCMKTRKTADILHPLSWTLRFFNLQRSERVWAVGKEHYDIGNDLYASMLGKHMQYTCGYWEQAEDLDTAQYHKMELISQKLKLEPGMNVLDIGCGFGSLAHHLASKYFVRVVGCSISKEQTKYGEKLCQESGLSCTTNKGDKGSVTFLICDYRDLLSKNLGTFDRIVSVGMFEHVGPHNYSEFFQIVKSLMDDSGIFLLHTIGNNHPQMPCVSVWLHRRIFPNGVIPYFLKLFQATEGLFVLEDLQNFSHDYSKTIHCWRENFEKAWPNLRTLYGEKFYKVWTIYLSLAEAAFISRSFQLWQIVLSKDGLPGGYKSKRLYSP